MFAQIEQTLSELHSMQFVTPQVKHWFRTWFKVNPVWQPRHVPVMLLQRVELQLVGHEGAHCPWTAEKPSLQLTQAAVESQARQLGMAQRIQTSPVSWKSSWQAEQTSAAEQLAQLETLQERQVPEAVRLNRVKQIPQTSLSAQVVQLATAQEKGWQVALTSWKFVEQLAQTFSAEQIAQFSTTQAWQVPLMTWRLFMQDVQFPT